MALLSWAGSVGPDGLVGGGGLVGVGPGGLVVVGDDANGVKY